MTSDTIVITSRKHHEMSFSKSQVQLYYVFPTVCVCVVCVSCLVMSDSLQLYGL